MPGEICHVGLVRAFRESVTRDLLSAGWRPGRAGGVVPVQT